MEEELEVLKDKIIKIKKSNIKKLVKTKKTVTKKNIASREKSSKVIGEELLHKYVTEIRSFVERKQYYPKKARRMRQSGAVEICLDIDHNGQFLDVHIKKASAYSALNNAALSLIQEISKFKPLPKEMGNKITLSIPLTYALND
jgi:TonB family protein